MRSVVKSLLPDEGILVDLGCGSGELLESIDGEFELRVGLDARDRRKVAGGGAKSSHWVFVTADLDTRFPLADESVDAVIANQVIEHLRDPRTFAAEIHRVLRRGGVALVTTPNIRYVKNIAPIVFRGVGPRTAGYEMDGLWDGGHIHYFTHKDLFRVFSDAGFSRVQSRGLVNRGRDNFARRVLDKLSSHGIVWEFLTGNILVVVTR